MYSNPWGSVCPRCSRAPYQCICPPLPYHTGGVVPKGCVCPPGAESTCRRSDCGRKDQSAVVVRSTIAGQYLVSGTITGTQTIKINDAEENAHQRDPGDETD